VLEVVEETTDESFVLVAEVVLTLVEVTTEESFVFVVELVVALVRVVLEHTETKQLHAEEIRA
jgi:hypothetical protein